MSFEKTTVETRKLVELQMRIQMVRARIENSSEVDSAVYLQLDAIERMLDAMLEMKP
jgi:hypothetical protein